MVKLGPVPFKPGGDIAPYVIDFTEYVVGRTSQAGDNGAPVKAFRGRPGFADDFHDMLVATRVSLGTASTHRYALRHLLRYLDEFDPEQTIASCAGFKDHHGPALIRALPDSQYAVVKPLVDAMRRVRRLPALYWGATRTNKPAVLEELDEEAIGKFYLALKSEAHKIRLMFAEGERLADTGSDPRLPGADRKARANQAWLVRELSRERLIPAAEFPLWSKKVQLDHQGPQDLAPGIDRRLAGYYRQLRWFYPGVQDTSVMLWLFLILTGWNLATALSIDISSPDSWHQDHPHKPRIAILRSFKSRSGRQQLALSDKKPRFHPYRIIEFMIERTSSMRSALQHERNLLGIGDPDNLEIMLKIGQLDAALKSPWLVHRLRDVGEVFMLRNEDAPTINEVARSIVKAHKLDLRYPALLFLTTKMARKAWIGHAHAAGGQSALVAKLAAQHVDHSTLPHYLNSPSQRVRNETAMRDVQDAIFGEIASGRALDPTRLRLIAQNGGITADQEKRLLDLRQRTRLGMGCLEPTAPPKSIAPGHIEGNLCRVQRCTGCKHGVVFSESLDPLARAHAELIRLKATIPFSAWSGSSFEDEERSIEATLQQFDKELVASRTAHWLELIQSGRAGIHDAYPSY